MRIIIAVLFALILTNFVQSRYYLKSRHKQLYHIDLDDEDVETLGFLDSVGKWIRNNVPVVKNIADTVDAAKRGDKGEAAASFFGVAGIKHAVENKDAKAGVLEGLGFAADLVPGVGKGLAVGARIAAKAGAKGAAKNVATTAAKNLGKASRVVNKTGKRVEKVNRVANDIQQIQQGQIPDFGGMKMSKRRKSAARRKQPQRQPKQQKNQRRNYSPERAGFRKPQQQKRNERKQAQRRPQQRKATTPKKRK
jgi:hypothetical protein